MSREALIQKTLDALSKLPQNKVIELADFAEYLLKKYDEDILQKEIEKLTSNAKTFEYFKNEEDIYTLKNLKERYK